jgi:hypothetical protein
MKLKNVKLASLFFTLIPLVCFLMFSKTGNGTYVTMALVSVGAQFVLRRTFWVCPRCKNRLPGTVEHTCPYCGTKLDI